MTKEITVSTSGDKAGEVSQEKLQEKLMLFQLMEKQMEVLNQQRTMINSRLVEIETTRVALKETHKLKPDNEAIVPIGSGLYVKAIIKKKDILTDIGANIIEENDIKGALAILDGRKNDLEKTAEHLEHQTNGISKQLNELGPYLQKMAGNMQG